MKTKLIYCLLLCFLCCSLQAKTRKSNGSKKATTVVLNAHYWGLSPESFNEANFETAFPDGLTIGHGTKKLSFTSYSKILNFLNSKNYLDNLSIKKKLNFESKTTILARHLAALTLSIGFDFVDQQNFLNSQKLADFTIQKGFYKSKTVQQFLKIANGIYGDVAHTSSISNLISTAKFVTQEFSKNKSSLLSISSLTLLSDVKCYGGNNGREKVTVYGGVPLCMYTYTLSNGTVITSANNYATFSNLSAGNYTVTVTDSYGTVAVGANTFTISEPSMLVALYTATDVTCSGLANGTATVIPSGGIAPYSILWNNGSTSLTLTNLAAGTYTAMLMDTNGCCKPITVYVDVPEMLMVSASSSNVLCFGGANGLVSASASGGTAPLSILWSNGSSSFSQTGLTAGTYTAVITDVNGCFENVSATINEPSLLVGSSSSTDVLCYGEASGTATATASGGTAPYTILWSNGATSFSQTGLAAGTYTAIVSDVNLCCKPISVTIEQPEILMAMVEATDVFCFNGNSGLATASAMGGTAPYTILWSNGNTDFDLTGLAAGTYTATITDANGCSTSVSVLIEQPDELTSEYSQHNPSCCYGTSGTATVTSYGGTPTHTILWSNGSTSFSQIHLSAGTLTYVVTDANSCTTNGTVTILGSPLLAASAISANATCYGSSTGSAVVTSSGGTAPHTILWSNGMSSFNPSGLTAGTYTATITDANGCSTSISVFIEQPDELTSDYSQVNPTCCSGNNGSATVTSTGGTPDHSILWSNGATSFSNTGLAAGTYTYVVTDANGCSSSGAVIIVMPAAMSASFVAYNATCYGSSTGSVIVTSSGGTVPHSILWSNGMSSFNPSGLAAGTYTATITDANGCLKNISITIEQPTQLTSDYVQHNPSCCYGTSGTATVTSYGGTPTHTILWSNGSTSFSQIHLSAGTLTYVVTDANSCTTNGTVTIFGSPLLAASAISANATCYGSSTGSAIVTSSGGTAPHSILWSNGMSSFNPSGLSAGTYTATITDANGCSTSVSVLIEQPATIVTTVTQSNPSCCGGANASVTVLSSGGTPIHAILWNNNSTSFTRTGLTAGTYSYVVTDANGCAASGSVTIVNATPIVILITKTNVIGYGGYGTATAHPTGGTAPYTYKWYSNPLQYTQTASLHAGTWKVRVTDANGCKSYKWVTLTYGPCSGYVTLPRGIYGQECEDGGWSCYLSNNFTASFPNGLTVGSGNNFLNFTSASAIANFLPSSNYFGALNSGTMQDPTSGIYTNGLAAQAITLTITLSFNNNLDFSTPTAPLGGLFVSSGLFTGMTVDQVLAIANTILGGGSSIYSPADVFAVLDAINNNFENGTVDLGYLVLTNPTLATISPVLNVPILTYVVFPNPVKDVSKIEFSLTDDTSVSVHVYDLNGRLISNIYKGHVLSGQKYYVDFDSNQLADGTYFIKLITDFNVYNKSVLVSK